MVEKEAEHGGVTEEGAEEGGRVGDREEVVEIEGEGYVPQQELIKERA